MKSSTTDTDKGFKRAVEAAKSMKGSYVDVGYWGPATHPSTGTITMVGIASIHEYGSAPANIPQRSFLRSTIDEKRPRYILLRRQYAEAILAGEMTCQAALEGLGEIITSDVQAKFSEPIPPPLAEKTIARRRHGGDTPLVDTGALRASIQTRVVVRGQVVVERGGG